MTSAPRVSSSSRRKASQGLSLRALTVAASLFAVFLECLSVDAAAGPNLTAVTTYHNDNFRTGQTTGETVLTPQSVNPQNFGKLFAYPVDGFVYAQPLYLPNVTLAGRGTYNLVVIATENDSVYAFDADNLADNPTPAPLWRRSFINPAAGITTISSQDDLNGCTDIRPKIGITGTPVIDPKTQSLYLVAKTKENGVYHQRLHQLDLTTGKNKVPATDIHASYPGNGVGSSGGKLSFDPLWHGQRAALLLSNGLIYIAWNLHCDPDALRAWHGWVLSYDAASLKQTAVFNTTPNGVEGGIWGGGGGLSADASGHVFFATGNGTFDADIVPPVNLGDSVLKLSSKLSVLDYFTPYNQADFEAADEDQGSGSVLILPHQSGPHPRELITAGKEGRVLVIDRDQMGHYNANGTSDPQIVQSLYNQFSSLLGTPAYWRGDVYLGTAPEGVSCDPLKAFRLASGKLLPSPASVTSETFCFPGPTPSVSSAPDLSGGIVWALRNGDFNHRDIPADLYAYDARNLAKTLYSSRVYADVDSPGAPVKFTVPTVANGKVYVGGQKEVAVYGILPASRVATPSFSLLPATITGNVKLGLADRTAGSTIYFTTDDTDPINSPTRQAYQTPISLSATTTIEARATQAGHGASPLAAALYTIFPSGPLVDYRSGFSVGGTHMQLNGYAQWKSKPASTRLRLTDGGIYETSSAFYKTPIDIRRFTTDFNVQLLLAMAHGMTFTIQGNSASALGDSGAALGYGGSPGIPKGVAVKLDLYNFKGEGVNSTGLYTDGAMPTVPAVTFPSGTIDLHSADVFNVHITYDGARLTMTVTDLNQPDKTFKTSWLVNIPKQVGANSAYVGFTAGTGYGSSVQEVMSWTFIPRVN